MKEKIQENLTGSIICCFKMTKIPDFGHNNNSKMETGGKTMSQTIGTQSIQFDQAPYILGSASIVGTKEGEGPLGE